MSQKALKGALVRNAYLTPYLSDTLKSLENMRGDNALLADTIWLEPEDGGPLKVSVLNPDTSPTNIAVDLLVQAEIGNVGEIESILATLNRLPFHQPSGLFFSRYSTDITSSVRDRDVSSIDNLHLAIALWTIKENYPATQFGAQAKRLFERMDFQIFYDRPSGLIGGNLHFENVDGGVWRKEKYNFDNFGSEARLLYSVGAALGLFHKEQNNKYFFERAVSALKIELVRTQQGDLLRLWDGSAFQLLFPKIFAGEENYSKQFRSMYQNYANYIIAEGERRDLPLPAGHSAGRVSKEEYRDKSGLTGLVSIQNNDLSDANLSRNWSGTVHIYAIFMTMTSTPEKLKSVLQKTEAIESGPNRLYAPGHGFMDGLHVEGPSAGEVVPAQLSLNQGMIALSILQLQAQDGMSASTRSLMKNPRVKKSLVQFYKLFDEKIGAEF